MNDLLHKNRMRIGRNISRLRKAAKMTQQDLADELNDRMGTSYKVSAISAWEKGNNSINSDYMPYFADIFDVPLSKLYSQSFYDFEKPEDGELIECILYDLNDVERLALRDFVAFLLFRRGSSHRPNHDDPKVD